MIGGEGRGARVALAAIGHPSQAAATELKEVRGFLLVILVLILFSKSQGGLGLPVRLRADDSRSVERFGLDSTQVLTLATPGHLPPATLPGLGRIGSPLLYPVGHGR